MFVYYTFSPARVKRPPTLREGEGVAYFASSPSV